LKWHSEFCVHGGERRIQTIFLCGFSVLVADKKVVNSSFNVIILIMFAMNSTYIFIWQIAGTDKFAKVIDFLRRQLHRETLVKCHCVFCSHLFLWRFCILNFDFLILQFVYVNSAFSPNPDELVIDLFNVRHHLIPSFPLIFISSLNVDRADLWFLCYSYLYFSQL